MLAESATTLHRERKRGRITADKARGVYRNYQPLVDPAEVRRLRAEEWLRPATTVRPLGIVLACIYHVLAAPPR